VLRPLLLNTRDSAGGAAIATYRIHRALRGIGVASTLLVQKKSTGDPAVVGPRTTRDKVLAEARMRLDPLIVSRYRERQSGLFSPAIVPDGVEGIADRMRPDIIHLFWVASGFLRVETIGRFKVPVVWTLHDMWPFTGGCHYDGECGRYRKSCGSCPVLGSSKEHDLSRRVWERKRSSWRDADITIVATSRWLADCARASSLFRRNRIEVLPNAIDIHLHKPVDRAVAREVYGLPQDKKLILFAAPSATTDPRKGFQFLIPAVQQLAAEGWRDRAEVVVVGASQAADGVDLGLTTHYAGRLNDEISQVLLYSAADVVVCPSVQENLSNTVMESLTCGTPVVAFAIGGMPDLIRSKENGFLAEPFSPASLAAGIRWVLEDSERQAELGARARAGAVSTYEMSIVARQYEALYLDILG
jgi:glycosyltransferase involved in cell wall biosynthesis